MMDQVTTTLVATAYGDAAHEALADAVRDAKNGDPLAHVTVVVPNNYVGIAARRALGRRGVGQATGIAAVTISTPYALAEQLGGPIMARDRRTGVSTVVIAAAVRSVLSREPGHFRGVEHHPATEQALARAHRELSELTERQLDALAGRSRRSGDVVRIHREVAAALSTSYSNEQDLCLAATRAAADDPAEVRRRLGPMIVFLPQRVTSSQARLLRAVAGATETTVIAGVTGAEDADATVRASLQRLDLDLDATESAASSDSPPTVEVVSVSDADDEVRHALRQIVNAARDGTPLGRCAILYGVESPYLRLIGDALDAAGIARCGAVEHTAETSLLGRSLLGLLTLRDGGFARRAVMSWLASSPVTVQRADGEGVLRWRGIPSAAWEREARAARVESGIDSWRARLTLYAEDCTAEADQFDSQDEPHIASRLRRSAQHSLELLEFIERLHDDLDPSPRPHTWQQLARWCERLVGDYLGGHKRENWPDDERKLAEAVDAAVSRLGNLDSIDDVASLEAFIRALRLELEGGSNRRGRLGTGVLVGPLELALGLELDLVIVCGMAEGVFPARRNEDSLLPDRERRVVGRDLPARGDRSGDEHRALLAVTSAAGRTVLMFPRGDLRKSAERTPSRWMPRDLDVEEVQSFVAGLRRTEFPAHFQEYDMRELLDWHDARSAPGAPAGSARGGRPVAKTKHGQGCTSPTALHSVRSRVELQRGIQLIQARMSTNLTRFDGNLAAGDLRGAAVPGAAAGVVSASRLQTWAGCPHQYFMRYVLRVEPIDDPDDEHRINALERGSLVHRVLELWLKEAMAKGPVPRPSESWTDRHRERLRQIGEQECDALAQRGLVGRKLYWQHDRRQLLNDLERFIDFDNAQRAEHASTPVAAELDFGMRGRGTAPVEIEIGDGRTLRLRGSIDRVDTTPGGGLVVADYKTGRSDDYSKLSTANPTQGGAYLQIVLYDLAARKLRQVPDTAPGYGAYWFVSTKGKFKSHGYATNDARERVLDEVRLIVDSIANGLFPLRPPTPEWRPFTPCEFCDPDQMGTRDTWRDWQRKLEDPALADYLELVESAS